MTKEYLTEEEVLEIERFCTNAVQFEAVKKVLLQHIYDQGILTEGKKAEPLKNRALVLVGGDYDDAQLGGRLRALWEGVNALETGYEDLLKIKSEKPKEIESPFNVAE